MPTATTMPFKARFQPQRDAFPMKARATPSRRSLNRRTTDANAAHPSTESASSDNIMAAKQSERHVVLGTVDDVAKRSRVKPMSDGEAYMRLVTDNAQGELSPLEIGIHALGSVELNIGGKGKTGGLSEYARQIGKGRQQVTQLRDAANVFERCQLTDTFQDKATHLYEVSRAPEITWPLLCEALQSGTLTTVDDVAKRSRVKPMSDEEAYMRRAVSSRKRNFEPTFHA